jgi:hypothetical protein
MAVRTPKLIPWTASNLAPSLSPAPRAFPIKAVAPVAIPVPMAMMIKNTGKERERDARACVEMRPPK